MSFAKCYFFLSNTSNLKFSHLSSFFFKFSDTENGIDTDRDAASAAVSLRFLSVGCNFAKCEE